MAANRHKWYRDITSILGNLASVAKDHGVDTALAKSGIPGLKGLVAVSDWWSERRQRNQMPEGVAGNRVYIRDIEVADGIVLRDRNHG